MNIVRLWYHQSHSKQPVIYEQVKIVPTNLPQSDRFIHKNVDKPAMEVGLLALFSPVHIWQVAHSGQDSTKDEVDEIEVHKGVCLAGVAVEGS